MIFQFESSKMASYHVIPGNQVCFDKFDGAEKKFRDILKMVQDADFTKCLEASTRIYSELVKEFYLNVVYRGGVLVTKIKGTTLQIGAS